MSNRQFSCCLKLFTAAMRDWFPGTEQLRGVWDYTVIAANRTQPALIVLSDVSGKPLENEDPSPHHLKSSLPTLSTMWESRFRIFFCSFSPANSVTPRAPDYNIEFQRVNSPSCLLSFSPTSLCLQCGVCKSLSRHTADHVLSPSERPTFEGGTFVRYSIILCSYFTFYRIFRSSPDNFSYRSLVILHDELFHHPLFW